MCWVIVVGSNYWRCKDGFTLSSRSLLQPRAKIDFLSNFEVRDLIAWV
jgi:hypothetical protein